MFLNAGIRPDQLKEQYILDARYNFFYVESCIKSSKQVRVIVGFNMLSFSSTFT